MELHHAPSQKQADDLNGLVLAGAAGLHVLVEPLELLGHPGESYAQGDAVVRHRRNRAETLGLEQRLADRQPEIRNACSVSVPGNGGGELAVLLIECRNNKPGVRDELVKHLHGLIHAEFGIDCKVEIVPRNSIPRTTSGKLARSAMRTDYINRTAEYRMTN